MIRWNGVAIDRVRRYRWPFVDRISSSGIGSERSRSRGGGEEVGQRALWEREQVGTELFDGRVVNARRSKHVAHEILDAHL